ncbi:gluconokinase [uncultured Phycicoccus sp.]|uniref:gluconokinase n=1 Tax=uncultured Phycicoccus sp. TaxID=661422 RepID=UPI0026363FBD|nr:gluconokinase [uncultured Phycicoccus sp.]
MTTSAGPEACRTRHVVVMGVSGSGKSTVARGVAEALGVVFADADDFHPSANVAKMTAGTPLTDVDRGPWLEDLAAWMAEQAGRGRSTVLACSALRRSYRDVLRHGPPSVQFVHLDGPAEVIAARLSGRSEHFMPRSLLESQIAAVEPLEPDEDGVVLDVRLDPGTLVERTVDWLRTA